MFCNNCGTQIPDEANFCWKCGKPQKGSRAAEAEEQIWETCEVEWESANASGIDRFISGMLLKETGCFVAKAIGQRGVYVAGKTQTFSTSAPMPARSDNHAVQMFNSLVAQLVKEGWEPVEAKGNFWYGNRFRRRARK